MSAAVPSSRPQPPGPRPGEGGLGRLRRASARRRARRWQLLRELLDWDRIASVLDLGGTPLLWWRSALHDRPVRVTCVNLAGLPRVERFGRMTVELVVGDATDARWADGGYDLVLSNSVLEHVGDRAARARLAAVARSGRQYVVQTPNRFFVLEPHFILPLHFLLPAPLETLVLMVWDRRPVLRSWAAARRRLDSIHLVGVAEMRQLFPDALLLVERSLGHTKSILAVGGPGLPPLDDRRRRAVRESGHRLLT